MYVPKKHPVSVIMQLNVHTQDTGQSHKIPVNHQRVQISYHIKKLIQIADNIFNRFRDN